MEGDDVEGAKHTTREELRGVRPAEVETGNVELFPDRGDGAGRSEADVLLEGRIGMAENVIVEKRIRSE